jgi:hypothetical protein
VQKLVRGLEPEQVFVQELVRGLVQVLVQELVQELVRGLEPAEDSWRLVNHVFQRSGLSSDWGY